MSRSRSNSSSNTTETTTGASQVKPVALRGNKNKKAAQRGKPIVKMTQTQNIEKV